MTATRTQKRQRCATEPSVDVAATLPEAATNDNTAMIAPSRELIDRIAGEVFRGVFAAVQGALRGDAAAASAPPSTGSDVMNADEAAQFLGVDRTTVYEFAGRGVIPHQRLGKRLLFRRGALVAWLDSSLCKATSTRKA